jgi:acetyltransferase
METVKPRRTSKPMVAVEEPQADRAHAVYLPQIRPLDAIFRPGSVAVIGASEREGSVGRTVLWNLLSSPFGGIVYPVNPKHRHVLGIQSFPSVKAIPETVALAVITTPAETVPGVIAECVECGVPAAVVISAGFKEHGERGQALEAEIAGLIRGRMRVIGPNCLGVMNPVRGLNATFAQTIARPGNVAFISQSGALCTAVLDWSIKEMVGFSAFVSVGSMLDIGWGDLIDYFGDDPRTNSILIYMESIGDARAFLSSAREVSFTKPIIVIKAGRTAAAAQAAASHTGALTGSDEVLDAAFRRCGVLRVNSIADIFYMAEVLAKQPRPSGPRLAIVTNAGGPGVLATDALIGGGGELAELSAESRGALDAILPPHWSHGNPVDILGDADPERYAKTIEIVAKDPGADGLLVVMTPQGMTHPTQIAERMRPWARTTGKPLLASWMGGAEVAAGEAVLNHAGIPSFQFPDTAVRAFNYMWRYAYNLRGLYETPSLPQGQDGPQRDEVARILGAARRGERTLLSELDSKRVLAAYGIPVVETRAAHTPDEAAAAARAVGFPVAVKLHSETVTHKTDVGGVRLDVGSEAEVRAAFSAIQAQVTERAGSGHFLGVTVQTMVPPAAKIDGYELILGSTIDRQFGPVVMFGAGGQLVEVFLDRALALPPLNSTLARRLMEQTRIWKALAGVRGRAPVDLVALEQLLVRFSNLVVEQPWIQEIDVNPLIAAPGRLVALDARVVLHPGNLAETSLPRPAIRPYPIQYVLPWRMKSGEEVVIRPIRPEDEPLMIRFHEHLSERTVYLRYFQAIKLSQRTAHERLTRICFVDYDRDMVLAAERNAPTGKEIVAVGRLSKEHGTQAAEMAALVRDDFQHQGLGSELYRRLVQFARDERIARVHSIMLRENRAMRLVCEKLGFRVVPNLDPMEQDTIEAELLL